MVVQFRSEANNTLPAEASHPVATTYVTEHANNDNSNVNTNDSDLECRGDGATGSGTERQNGFIRIQLPERPDAGAGDISKIIGIVENVNKPQKAGKKFLQFAEGNIPFLNMYYSKAAYDYLIGYQIKEMLDPGFFERMRDRHEEQRGQTYYFKP